jgi:hypothetical protein
MFRQKIIRDNVIKKIKNKSTVNKSGNNLSQNKQPTKHILI